MATTPNSRQLLCDLANGEITLPSIPTHFSVLLRLRSAINDTHAPFRRVIDVINGEPVIAAKVIQTANSAAARSKDPILDVERAVFRLGLETVKRVALAVSMVQLANAKELMVFSGIARGLWLNSLYASASAATIARDLGGPKPDEASFLGLLSNLGGFYLLYLASKHESLTQTYDDVRLITSERNHELTLAMVQFLDLPKEICEPLDTARLNGRYINSPPESLMHLLYAARLLANERFDWADKAAGVSQLDPAYAELKDHIESRYEGLKIEYA